MIIKISKNCFIYFYHHLNNILDGDDVGEEKIVLVHGFRTTSWNCCKYDMGAIKHDRG